MIDRGDVFADRRDAGRRLAEVVEGLGLDDPVVLALPRGGVPVAYEVARRLHAPLDIMLVRKIGAPGHEEYGIGALVDGDDPQVIVDQQAARMVGADQRYVEGEVARQLAELERRRTVYSSAAAIPLKNRTVVVIDDGIATGGTVKVVLQSLRQSGARKVVLAVPVAPASAVSELRKLCDRVISLLMPEPFHAVGAHYRDFSQTSDAEVIELLAEARKGLSEPTGPSETAAR